MSTAVTFNYVTEQVREHGGRTTYTLIKDEFVKNKKVRANLTVVPQSAKRSVFVVPKDVADEFVAEYVVEYPRTHSKPPITQAANDPRQMELPIGAPAADVPLQQVNDRITRLENLMERYINNTEKLMAEFMSTATVIDNKVNKLLNVWDAIGDDNK